MGFSTIEETLQNPQKCHTSSLTRLINFLDVFCSARVFQWLMWTGILWCRHLPYPVRSTNFFFSMKTIWFLWRLPPFFSTFRIYIYFCEGLKFEYFLLKKISVGVWRMNTSPQKSQANFITSQCLKVTTRRTFFITLLNALVLFRWLRLLLCII